MARFEADHGDPDTAVGLSMEAYDDRPTVFAAEVAGWALYQAGRSEEALVYAEESLRLGTLDAALLLHAARIFEAAGQTDRALQLKDQAAGFDPWYGLLHPELTTG